MSLSERYPVWLRTALQQRKPVSVRFPGDFRLWLYPEENRYQSSFALADLPRVNMWNTPAIAVEPVNPAQAAQASEAGALPGLLWAVLWDEARRNAEARHANLRFGLIRLVSWPDLGYMPEEITAPLARMCALLQRKSTAGGLLPTILNLPKQQAFALLALLHEQGHLTVSMPAGLSIDSAKTVHDEPKADAEAMGVQTASTSLVGKLWAKLVSVA